MTKLKKLFSQKRSEIFKAYIIAEIGINHEGNVNKCAQMIKNAASSGANAIKLQTVNADKSYSKETESYKIFKKAEISKSDTEKMFKYARKLGVEPFTTSGDLETLEWVDKLKPVAHKISSGLLSCTPILKAASKLLKPIILSSGMSDYDEIKRAISYVQKINKKIILLHCTSEYPCNEKNLNLSTITSFKNFFSVPIGFSDHSLGIKMAPLAVGIGAVVIEKHFTYDSKRKGFDHNISLMQNDFKLMVREIRLVEKVLGNSEKKILNSELKNYHRSIATAYNLKAGHKLTLQDLLFMRFEKNINLISANETNKILGKVIKKDYLEKQALIWKDIK